MSEDEISYFHQAIMVLQNGLDGFQKIVSVRNLFYTLLPTPNRNMHTSDPYKVNLLNGTLHIMQDGDKWMLKFLPHSKSDYLVNTIPVRYDETGLERNEEFLAMVDRILSKDPEKVDKICLLQEMYGACVAPIFPHLFMLHGPGGSGKTSLMIPAMRLVDPSNYSSVEPHEFKGFNLEEMAGRLVNFVTDIDVLEPISDANIKKIEDRVPIRIARKFKTAALGVLPAIHIFAGNDIPATYEKGSGAHKRRCLFLLS